MRGSYSWKTWNHSFYPKKIYKHGNEFHVFQSGSIKNFGISDKYVNKLAYCHIYLLILLLLFSSQKWSTASEDRKMSAAVHSKKKKSHLLNWAFVAEQQEPVDQFSVSQCCNLGEYSRSRRANPLGLSFSISAGVPQMRGSWPSQLQPETYNFERVMCQFTL